MGRLDDQAKKRIVELRKAGLSFRKIKKVLEVDNIRVTPQAIYLFLKRKNVQPSAPSSGSDPPPGLKKGSRDAVLDQVSWEEEEEDQCWKLPPENEAGHARQREDDVSAAGVSLSCEMPLWHDSRGDEEGIRIVGVASLNQDEGQFGRQSATRGGFSKGSQPGSNTGGSCPVRKDSGSDFAPVAPAGAQPNMNGKGTLFLPPARNPALIWKRKIVGRAIHLQKKASGHAPSSSPLSLPSAPRVQPAAPRSRATVPATTASLGCGAQSKDASAQTSAWIPTCSTGHPSAQWGSPVAVPSLSPASPHPFAEKLDAVHAEVQKLTQAVHMVLERQCQLERQQEQQQRFQQEVLVTLQQLSSMISHLAVPNNVTCAPYSSISEPSPPLPNFSQFKMEFI
nr:uncharacterized protein LOC110089816 isoform X2 [Pogona vitticeps]XP_020668792.1 uncharacterized protein LOC110089816 isoform X2 [Pogona vitticeps]XP_020668793.1 uncharacterized protein LOC110089816 isoform X2 [Pogona vitticeps]